jgi:hypothetical protein
LRFFVRLLAEGVAFVPLSEALDDPAYLRSGTIVTDAFQVHQIKIAAADGRALDAVPPTHKALIERVFELGTPLRPRSKAKGFTRRDGWQGVLEFNDFLTKA